MDNEILKKLNNLESKIYSINNLYKTMYDAIKTCNNENKDAYHLIEISEIIDAEFIKLISDFEIFEQKFYLK